VPLFALYASRLGNSVKVPLMQVAILLLDATAVFLGTSWLCRQCAVKSSGVPLAIRPLEILTCCKY
jgi:hypothetical protein